MIEAVSGLERFYAVQEMGAENGITENLLLQAQSARTLEDREKVKNEFFTMFYKEILKQAFKPSSFGFSEENDSSLTATYASDLFVEQMARELAQNQALTMKAGMDDQTTGR